MKIFEIYKPVSCIEKMCKRVLWILSCASFNVFACKPFVESTFLPTLLSLKKWIGTFGESHCCKAFSFSLMSPMMNYALIKSGFNYLCLYKLNQKSVRLINEPHQNVIQMLWLELMQEGTCKPSTVKNELQKINAIYNYENIIVIT